MLNSNLPPYCHISLSYIVKETLVELPQPNLPLLHVIFISRQFILVIGDLGGLGFRVQVLGEV